VKNITLSIDDKTYRMARIRAAEQNTSVSALVKRFLLEDDLGTAQDNRAVAGLSARSFLLARLRSERVIEVGRWSRDELYEDER
jgi:hypothetical protein